MEGHIRNFNMSTWNKGSHPNYHAWGIGGGIGYYSPIVKGFQFGISGFTIHRIMANELYKEGVHQSRYELPLFDVENPDNKHDMDRIENLFVKYYLKNSSVKLGKMTLTTPFINPQDSRLRPNLQEGIWIEINDIKNMPIKGGIIWRNSPRGTVNWYGMGESMGLYPTGYNYFNYDYAGQIQSDFIAINQIAYRLPNRSSVEFWNYYADRLFYLGFVKGVFRKSIDDHRTLKFGLQGLFQQAIQDDHNTNLYMYKNEQALIGSGRIGIETKRHDIYLNGTYTGNHGRFVFPREWGREPFFTFIPRERLEGNGGVRAVSMNYHRRHKDSDLRSNISTGMFWYPELDNPLLNKYQTPSYLQTNVSINYNFHKALDGLEINLLYAYKHSMKEIEYEQYHNKMHLHHFNLIIDYFF